jgi:hypothetical protein
MITRRGARLSNLGRSCYIRGSGDTTLADGGQSGGAHPSRRCHDQRGRELRLPAEHQCGQRYMLRKRWQNWGEESHQVSPVRRPVRRGGAIRGDGSSPLTAFTRRDDHPACQHDTPGTWKDVEHVWRAPQTNLFLSPASPSPQDAKRRNTLPQLLSNLTPNDAEVLRWWRDAVVIEAGPDWVLYPGSDRRAGKSGPTPP